MILGAQLKLAFEPLEAWEEFEKREGNTSAKCRSRNLLWTLLPPAFPAIAGKQLLQTTL